MAMKKKRLARCPRCQQATFRVEVGFTKPSFVCDNGCSSWSSGRDGRPYLEHARNYEGGGPEKWVAFVWRGDDFVKTGNGTYNERGQWVA